MPHGTRLYSIAASRYGDEYNGKTTSLCVRRATFWDSEKNAEDPAKKGICSNFLCDAKPGDEITMTGLCPGTAEHVSDLDVSGILQQAAWWADCWACACLPTAAHRCSCSDFRQDRPFLACSHASSWCRGQRL